MTAHLRPVEGATPRYDEDGVEIVQVATCGHCGHSWNDAATSHLTPAPSGRCPFEYEHEYEDEVPVEDLYARVADRVEALALLMAWLRDEQVELPLTLHARLRELVPDEMYREVVR